MRFGYFHGNNTCQTFTEVISGNLHFYLFQHFAVFGIFFERTRQRTAETGQVRTAFYGIDVVDVGVDIFRITVVIHDGYFDESNAVDFRSAPYFDIIIDGVTNLNTNFGG